MPTASVSVLMVQAAVALSPAAQRIMPRSAQTAGFLVGEHDHLQAVVRHVAGEVLVDLHHRAAEVLAIAAHGEFGAGVGRPLGEGFGQLLVIPGEKKVAEFVVVDRIGVGRIGDPEVAGLAEVAGV